MDKLLSADAIRAWDQYTIQRKNIASIDLMERACDAFVEWFIDFGYTHTSVLVICGTGNNGGDGLGIARKLFHAQYSVQVVIVAGSKASVDFRINRERLPSSIPCVTISSIDQLHLKFDNGIIIDAVFGLGLTRPTEGVHADIIRWMNRSSVPVIAVDVPSGLQMDAPSKGEVVRAKATVTFQTPKYPFFMPSNYQYVGEWHVVDIGLDATFLADEKAALYHLNEHAVRSMIKRRTKFDHKGTFGKALIVAGSYGKMGAAVLCARAALRAGLGLLICHVPAGGYSIMQQQVWEAMVETDREERLITHIPHHEYNALALGPGLGTDGRTIDAIKLFLSHYQNPVVFDADALNAMSIDQSLKKMIPPQSILTPHPKEFERLVGTWTDDFDKHEKQRVFAKTLKVFVLLKGGYSAVATPDGDLYFNSSGNPGMATGGSGDVLTGILAGLLAQGYSSNNAVLLGMYIHGLAGDIAVAEVGETSLIASDLIQYLPKAFRHLSPS